MSLRWYVVRTLLAAEKIAAENLERQGFGVFLPMGRGRPLLGNYLFVSFDVAADRWRAVNGTRGVQHLLPLGIESPIPLREGIVEEWRGRIAAGEFEPKAVCDWLAGLVVGDEVEVVGGPLALASRQAERVGRFLGRERGAVVLLMGLLGAERRVRVEPQRVAAPGAVRG